MRVTQLAYPYTRARLCTYPYSVRSTAYTTTTVFEHSGRKYKQLFAQSVGGMHETMRKHGDKLHLGSSVVFVVIHC